MRKAVWIGGMLCVPLLAAVTIACQPGSMPSCPPPNPLPPYAIAVDGMQGVFGCMLATCVGLILASAVTIARNRYTPLGLALVLSAIALSPALLAPLTRVPTHICHCVVDHSYFSFSDIFADAKAHLAVAGVILAIAAVIRMSVYLRSMFGPAIARRGGHAA